MIEPLDAGLFTSAVITDIPVGADSTYVFVKFVSNGTENGLDFSKGDGAFLWKDEFPCENLYRGQTVLVSDVRLSKSYKRPGDKKFCCNFAPKEFQPELSDETSVSASVTQQSFEQPVSQQMTPAIQKVVDSAIADRKAGMQGLNSRLQVSRTFKGKRACYLQMLADSAGTPSEALEACLDYCYDQNFGF